MEASKLWLLLLASAVAGCGKQMAIASDVAIKHRHDAALQRQIELLQAERVRVSAAAPTGGAGLAVLTLEVMNPATQPPDTLKQRVHKLAHLLVLDLASPGQYQAVNALATFKPGFFSPGGTSSSQAFIYSTASLR